MYVITKFIYYISMDVKTQDLNWTIDNNGNFKNFYGERIISITDFE